MFEKKMKKMANVNIRYVIAYLVLCALFVAPSHGAATALPLADTQVAVPLRHSGKVQTMFRHQTIITPKACAVAPVKSAYAATAVPVVSYRASDAYVVSFGPGTEGDFLGYQGRAVLGQTAAGRTVAATDVYSGIARRPVVSMAADVQNVQTSLVGRRKVYHAGAETDGNGNYWDDDAEDWLPIPGGSGSWPGGITSSGSYIGQTQQGADGKWYMWNGTDWILNESAEPPTPLGDAPYWLLLGGLLLYAGYKRKLQTTQN